MVKKLISISLICCVFFVMIFPNALASSTTEIFVDAVSGKDSNSGTIGSPLKTVSAARDKVRALTKAQTGDIIVYLREGIYFQEETLKFNEKDSGQNGFDVVYKAYDNEKVVISGGKEITGWHLYDEEKNIYRAPALGIDTRGITVNGVKAQRARSEDNPLSNVESWSTMGMTTSDTFMLDWENITDAEMVFQNTWFNSRCGIQSVEKKGNRVRIEMDQPGWRYISTRGSYPVLEPEYIENAYELLDTPGEWYLNKSEDCFYYMPLKNEDPKSLKVYAWVLEELVSVMGSSLDAMAHNIRFEDLSFQHVTYLRPNSLSGHSDSQNNYIRNQEEDFRDHLMDGAVEVERAYNIPFTGCEFTQIGAIGLRFRGGVQNSDITGCHFHQIGAGGIQIGDAAQTNPDYVNPPDERLYMKSNNIRNNYIHHTGRDFRSSSGIGLGYVIDTEVSHNEIEWVPYCGMHVGYGWDSVTSILQGVKIINNFIQNALYEKMYDGGAIYTNGYNSGKVSNMNIIAENFIQDTKGDYASIYQDNGSSYWRVTRNVIDNYNYPKSEHGSPSRNWLLNTGNGISLHYIDNWTVVPENDTPHQKALKAIDQRIEGTKVVPDCMWDKEALEIIAKAGLEPEWKARLGGIDKKALDKIIIDSDIAVDLGEEKVLSPVVLNNSGEVVDVKISYEIRNPEILSVSGNSIKGVSRGVTDVTVIADNGDGKPLEKVITVTVGDIITTLDIYPANSELYVGDRVLLENQAKTLLGFTVEDTNVKYTSSNESIANVDAYGYLEAYSAGECVITASINSIRGSFSEQINLKVLPLDRTNGIEAAVNSSGLNVTEASFKDIINDVNGWKVPTNAPDAKITPGDGMITVETPGSSVNGYGNYAAKTFQNELLNFNMKINGTDAWYALGLRVQSKDKSPVGSGTAGTSGYVIVFNPTTIELHRFNNAQRTVFYGDMENFESKAGKSIPNRLMSYNEEHNVQVGAINVAEGVLIILMIDGEVVFWHIDSYDERIEEPGYFSFIARKGSIEFKNPEKTPLEFTTSSGKADDNNTTVAGRFPDTMGHWASEDIAFLSAKGIFKGDAKGYFNPESRITRAELITALTRTIGERKSAYRGSLTDIVGTEWYAGYIQTALEKGLINSAMLGQNDEFKPNAAVTREETASILAGVLATSELAEINQYSDVWEITPAYTESIRKLVAAGVMTGKTFNTIAPKATLTRAEAATVISRLVKILSK